MNTNKDEFMNGQIIEDGDLQEVNGGGSFGFVGTTCIYCPECGTAVMNKSKPGTSAYVYHCKVCGYNFNEGLKNAESCDYRVDASGSVTPGFVRKNSLGE